MDGAKLPTTSDRSGIPARITPEEIFRRIDDVRGSLGDDLQPGVLARIFLRPERERARAINEAKTSAVRARKELIDGLGDAIKTYIDIHKGDLKIRGAGFVIATFAEMLHSLNRIMESSYVGFLETYSSALDRIQRIPNLTEEQQKAQISAAYRRAETAIEDSQRTFASTLEALRIQVVSVVEEIGA
jgi:hypothetical protein